MFFSESMFFSHETKIGLFLIFLITCDINNSSPTHTEISC